MMMIMMMRWWDDVGSKTDGKIAIKNDYVRNKIMIIILIYPN